MDNPHVLLRSLLLALIVAMAAIGPAHSASLWRGSGARASILAPDQVTSATLEEWFRADVGCLNGSSASCANGDAVATWQDQSGNSRNATVASGCTTGPTFHSNIINSEPALTFNGNDTQCLHNSYNGDPGTIIAVYYATPDGKGMGGFANPNFSYLLGAGSSNAMYAYALAPSAEIASAYNAAAAGAQPRAYSRGTTGSTTDTSWATFTNRQLYVWDILTVTNDGSTLKEYTNAKLLGSSAIPGGQTAFTPTTGQYIGNQYYGGGLNPGSAFKGQLAELAVYDAPISSDDQAAVVAYFQNKYGQSNGSGNYIVTANGIGLYQDLNIYMFQSASNTSFAQQIPFNADFHLISGHTQDGFLGFVLLHDTQQHPVKYNGLYWAQTDTDIDTNQELSFYTSSDFDPASGFGGTWQLAGTYACGTDCYNDEWLIDPNNSNATYIIFSQ